MTQTRVRLILLVYTTEAVCFQVPRETAWQESGPQRGGMTYGPATYICWPAWRRVLDKVTAARYLQDDGTGRCHEANRAF